TKSVAIWSTSTPTRRRNPSHRRSQSEGSKDSLSASATSPRFPVRKASSGDHPGCTGRATGVDFRRSSLVREADAIEATVQLGWLPGQPRPDFLAASVDGQWWDSKRIETAVRVPDLSIAG